MIAAIIHSYVSPSRASFLADADIASQAGAFVECCVASCVVENRYATAPSDASSERWVVEASAVGDAADSARAASQVRP